MTRMDQLDDLHMTGHEDDNPVVEVERSEHLIRRVCKDGAIEWTRLPHDPIGYDADVLEEAYGMGIKAARQQVENIRQNAYGRGVIDAARTAYGRGHDGRDIPGQQG